MASTKIAEFPLCEVKGTLVRIFETPSKIHPWNNKGLVWQLDVPINGGTTAYVYISPRTGWSIHPLYWCNKKPCFDIFRTFDGLDDRALGTRAVLQVFQDKYQGYYVNRFRVKTCLHGARNRVVVDIDDLNLGG